MSSFTDLEYFFTSGVSHHDIRRSSEYQRDMIDISKLQEKLWDWTNGTINDNYGLVEKICDEWSEYNANRLAAKHNFSKLMLYMCNKIMEDRDIIVKLRDEIAKLQPKQ